MPRRQRARPSVALDDGIHRSPVAAASSTHRGCLNRGRARDLPPRGFPHRGSARGQGPDQTVGLGVHPRPGRGLHGRLGRAGRGPALPARARGQRARRRGDRPRRRVHRRHRRAGDRRRCPCGGGRGGCRRQGAGHGRRAGGLSRRRRRLPRRRRGQHHAGLRHRVARPPAHQRPRRPRQGLLHPAPARRADGRRAGHRARGAPAARVGVPRAVLGAPATGGRDGRPPLGLREARLRPRLRRRARPADRRRAHPRRRPPGAGRPGRAHPSQPSPARAAAPGGRRAARRARARARFVAAATRA